MKERSIFRSFFRLLPQLIASLSASISCISDGMHLGWSAPVIPLLRSEDSPIRITESDETWLECIYSVGCLLGLPLTTYLVDKIGRKKSVLLASSLNLISWAIIALTKTVELFYLARILGGITGNMAYVGIPMYIAEIADKKSRGFLVSLVYLMIQIGNLFIYSLASFTSYYVPSVVGGLFIVLQLISLPFMPESPYFLLGKNQNEEARSALKRVRLDYQESELEEIARVVEKQNLEKRGFRDLFMVKSNRNASIIITLLVASQLFSGYFVMIMNVHSILLEADSIHIKPEFGGIIFSALMLLTLIVCSAKIDNCGRKILLIVSGISTSLCMLTISIYFTLKNFGCDIQHLNYIPTVATLAFAVCYRLGLGFVPQVLIAELFSHNVKALGMSLGDADFTIFSFISLLFYQYFIQNGKIEIALYVFSIVPLLSAIYTYFAVPETKGKSFEEIRAML